jgi:hypothetical protein
MWVTDNPVREAPRLWRRLFSERTTSGLYPLLLRGLGKHYDDPNQDRPWRTGELMPVAVDEVSPGTESLLRKLWHRATDTVDPAARAGMLARYEIPYLDWPGLVQAGPVKDVADRVALPVADKQGSCLLGVVPAATGAEAIAACGWIGPCNYATTAEIASVLRSWQERFGARVVSVGFATLVLSVAAPPTNYEMASRVAAEHHAFCPDTIYQGTWSLQRYAETLVGESMWWFWWD